MKQPALDPNSRHPARAVGALGAGVGLIYALAVRWLHLDPEIALPAAVILWPILQAEITKARVYAPDTVRKLLAAARGRGGGGE